MDYADISYLDHTENQVDKLERLQIFCIRFILGLRKYNHVSHFQKHLSGYLFDFASISLFTV